MEVQIDTTKADVVAFRFHQLLRRREGRVQLLGWVFGPPVGFAALLLIFSQMTHGWPHVAAISLSILTPLLYLGGVWVQLKRKLVREADLEVQNGNFILGKSELSLSQEGATVTRGSDVTFKTWKEIKRVWANRECGFLSLSDDDVVLIPRRCFPDESAFEMFVKSAVIFQWHGENANKRDAYAAAHPEKQEPAELKPVVISMPSR